MILSPKMTILESMISADRGRPRRRWVQDVINKLNMTAADARHVTRDRNSFRATVIGANFL
uniref:Uncharacterized protein n=1 Tax=Arion vulgaris TaxID=1028688 RepID=A0A0B7AG44_9EUPU